MLAYETLTIQQVTGTSRKIFSLVYIDNMKLQIPAVCLCLQQVLFLAFSFNWINIESTVIIMPLPAKVLDRKLPSQDPTVRKVKHSITLPHKNNDWILIISHLFYFKLQDPLVDLNGQTPQKKGRWP